MARALHSRGGTANPELSQLQLDPRPRKSTRPRRLEHLTRDTGYRWADEVDPICSELTRLITESRLTFKSIVERVNSTEPLSQNRITPQTLSKWMAGETKSPQNRKIDSVLKALGYRRIIQ